LPNLSAKELEEERRKEIEYEKEKYMVFDSRAIIDILSGSDEGKNW
jgi:hypothetical protein